MKKIKNIKIKTQKPTFTKSDLKTGDVVLYRNGKVGIVLVELGIIVFQTGFSKLDDLIMCNEGTINTDWVIIAVRRPKFSYDCQFCAFEHKFGTLVYQRFE